MITEMELAWIVFYKGLGGDQEGNKLPLKLGDSIKDFIFSWPDPCAFGLVVDAAEKLGWLWEFSHGWFHFVDWGTHETTKYEWRKDNPMWAVCLAFKEVLKLEGKLDEN